MIYELNQEAFQYISLLFPKPMEPRGACVSESIDIKGIPMILELKDVEITNEVSDNPFTGEVRTKYSNVAGIMIGLNEDSFHRFKKFIIKVYELPSISKSCSFDKLLEIAFDWLINVYAQQHASLQLIEYVENEIDRLTADYVFHFRMVAIGIEHSFVIGNTEFKYFDELEVNAHYQDIVGINPKLSYENFMLMIGKQYEGINAIVRVKGELDTATENAFAEAQLSVDVLKCFCFPYMMAKTTRSFDLDYRHPGTTSANYMYLINGNVSECRLNIKAMQGVRPIEMTQALLKEAEGIGMDVFSSFLRERKDHEFDLKIIEMIKLFAIAASSYDHYEKVIKCISLFESMAIPEGNPKAKGYTLFKKVVEKLLPEHQLKAMLEIGLTMYKVRDRLMHNNIKWPFEILDLLAFMDFMRIFILQAINILRGKGKMRDFYDHYGIIII